MSIPEDAEKLYTSLFNSETEDQKDQGVIDVTIRYDNSRRLALKKYYDAMQKNHSMKTLKVNFLAIFMIS